MAQVEAPVWSGPASGVVGRSIGLRWTRTRIEKKLYRVVLVFQMAIQETEPIGL
jgi:hypothetical protein